MEFLAFLLYTTILEGSVFVYDKELFPGEIIKNRVNQYNITIKKTLFNLDFSVVNQTTIECNDSHQKLMNDDFHLCVTEYTQDYYAYR